MDAVTDRAPMPEAVTTRVTYGGTATMLLELGPFTVLTDPNFLHRGQRAYLGKGLLTKRLTEPAIGPADLPELDAVVLSHLHGDHFDRRRARPRHAWGSGDSPPPPKWTPGTVGPSPGATSNCG
jgi:L-ascorbate metabolism protein UlaG (beta-lactamase superfamily)